MNILSSKEKLLASAQKNLQKGQIAKAIKDYQQVVELDPRDFRNRQKLAELFSRAQMTAEAFGEYGAVAKYYADTGFYLKAIAVYKQMQRLDPEQVNVYNRLAELNVKQGLVGNALAEYRNLAAYYEKKRLFTDAAAILQKMAELEPDNYNVKVKIAEAYAKAGLRDRSRQEFEAVLTALRQTGDYTRLARLYEFFLPLFPNDPEVKAGFAEVLIGKGEGDKGIQILKALLKEHPENVAVLKVLARGYRAIGDFENERLTCQHLLKILPEDLDLRQAHLRASLDSGEHRRALAEIEEWQKAFSDAGRTDTLVGFYRELDAVFPGNEHVQRSLASLSAAGVTAPPSDAAGEVEVLSPPAGAEPPPDDAPLITAPVPVAVATESPAPVVSTPPAADIEPEGAEEIPLAFLEAAADSVVAGPGAATHDSIALVSEADDFPHSAAAEPALAEQELDLELELELDLDAGEVIAVPATLEIAEPSGPDSSDAAEFDLEQSSAAVAPGEVDSLANANAEASELESVEYSLELSVADEAALPESEEAAFAFDFDAEPPVLPVPEQSCVVSIPEDDEEIIEELEEIIEDLEEIVEPEISSVAGNELGLFELQLDGKSPPVDTGAAMRDVRADLDEVEFYLQQGLLDDAERVCRTLLAAAPDCSEALEKLATVESRRRQSPSAAKTDEFFDLAAEILDEGALRATEGLPGLEDVDRFRVDGIFSEFKRGIESQIDGEDTETHYNLGIAYKEMGLLEDAVAEFDKAMKNPGRTIDCLTLKGICLAELGAFDGAAEVFKSGLAYPELNNGERTSLHYELGLLFEAWGRPLDALDSFQCVADSDLFFRDVGEKIRELRKRLGLDDGVGAGDESGAKGSKDRVSYV